LNLTANLGGGGGLNGNQQSVANGINSYFNNGGTLPPNFFSLFGMSGATLGNALSNSMAKPVREPNVPRSN
jgi:hypothetical protein